MEEAVSRGGLAVDCSLENGLKGKCAQRASVSWASAVL